MCSAIIVHRRAMHAKQVATVIDFVQTTTDGPMRAVDAATTTPSTTRSVSRHTPIQRAQSRATVRSPLPIHATECTSTRAMQCSIVNVLVDSHYLQCVQHAETAVRRMMAVTFTQLMLMALRSLVQSMKTQCPSEDSVPLPQSVCIHGCMTSSKSLRTSTVFLVSHLRLVTAGFATPRAPKQCGIVYKPHFHRT
eukprot:COSAG02_NODE_971_length_15551_cov_4.415157_19_plen_194_part_00